MLQAKILEAMRGDPNNVRMIATDGIVAPDIPDRLSVGDGLGQWEAEHMRDVLAMDPWGAAYQRKDAFTGKLAKALPSLRTARRHPFSDAQARFWEAASRTAAREIEEGEALPHVSSMARPSYRVR